MTSRRGASSLLLQNRALAAAWELPVLANTNNAQTHRFLSIHNAGADDLLSTTLGERAGIDFGTINYRKHNAFSTFCTETFKHS